MPKGARLSENHRKRLLMLIAEGSLAMLAVGATGSAIRSSKVLSGLSKEILNELRIQKNRKLRELATRKLIKLRVENDDSTTVELTHYGKILVRRYNLEEMQLQKPAVWDKKWRIIAYDIPVRKKKASQALSRKLHQFGLYQFQKSVWFSPYECLAELEFICKIFELELDEHLFYFKAESIPREPEIRDFFGIH